MNRKIFLLALCFVIVSVPMLFGAYENDVLNQPREVPVDGSSGHHGVPAVVREGMNLGRQTVIDSVLAPGVDAHMGLGWDGTYLYMASNETTPILVYVIDPETGTVVKTLTTGINTYILGCTYLNGSLWLQEWWTFGYTYEIDPSTGNILSYFTSPAGTNSRGLTNDGTDLWIMDASSAIAYQVTTTGTVVKSVSMPMVDWAMDAAWNFQRGTLFLCDNGMANNIKELDVSGSTATLLDEFAHPDPGGIPEGITYDGQYLWTCSFYGAWIWQIDIGDPAPVAAFWDFETGWQGWTHTNGLTFPQAWDVLSSGYKPTWTPPDAGDSTMWIDSDSAGTGVLVQDTALSPVVVPPTNMSWLKYGLGHNNLSDWVDVGLKYFDGAAWNIVTLKTYTDDFGPAWDSIDVSAYAGYDSVQVFFYYEGEYDWYAGFDNVELKAPVGHDVGSVAFLSPGAMVAPGTEDVIGVVHNFGAADETYDVHCVVTDPSVVLDVTLNVTTLVGESDTINFGSVVFQDGYTYDIMMATLLADDDPSNDTLYQSTYCTTAFWKIYADMPQASYYNAAVYTDVTGTPTVYSVGGDPTYQGIFEFDCNTETWSTSSATLNHEARRLAAAVVDGKIYAIGGMPGSGTTALNYCQEYDPVAGTVTDKTAMPTARQFLGAVAWNDTLIYVMGGQSGSSYYSTIEIYDPANDAWTTGTSLPITNRSFACGISGDTIYMTGGYNAAAYVAATYIGVIDPANPTLITWTTGPDIPIGSSGQAGRSRLQGACVQEKFYFTGGDDHGSSYPAYDTWYYDPVDLLWHQDLDKPTPISNSQCAVYVPILDQGTFFCCGGYNTAIGSGTAATEGRVNLVPGIAEKPGKPAPLVFGLNKIAPNPVRDGATVTYTTTQRGPVSLKVYDSAGRLVRTLIDSKNESTGYKTVYWDGTDDNHRSVAAGVYFYRLKAENKTASDKMIVIR